jgi:chemotaxis protein MotD
VLKVLTIQLHPVELGAVTVRIALKNDTLELQIEAGRHDTARLVEADRDQLSGLLRSAGYSVETMTVRAVEMPSAPAQAGSPLTQADGGAAQTQSGGAQADARASGGRQQAERNSNLHGTLRDSNDTPDSPRRRPGDGVYL